MIFVTLVGQGLSLIPLVRWLGLAAARRRRRAREIEVRIAALEAGLRKIDELPAAAHDDEEREVVERLRDEYVHRIEHLRSHHAPTRRGTPASRFDHEAQAKRCAPSAARSCACATAARSPTRSSAASNTTWTSRKRGCSEDGIMWTANEKKLRRHELA